MIFIIPSEIENFVKNKIIYEFEQPYLLNVNRCGCHCAQKDFYITRDNSYNYYVFHYVTSGTGLLIMDGKEYRLKKNDLFIISPNQSHIYTSNNSNPLHMIWVEFDGYNCPSMLSTIISKKIRVLSVDNYENVERDFVNLVEYVYHFNDCANPFQMSALLYCLICSILDYAHRNTVHEDNYPKWLEDAKNYILQHYKEHISVSEVANYLGYSAEHFSRLFSKNMGVGVWEYITMLRIEQSISMLIDKENTVKSIATALSFTDSTHFIKSFKNMLGVSPQKYRKFFLNQ